MKETPPNEKSTAKKGVSEETPVVKKAKPKKVLPRRNPNRPRSKQNYYFTEETQNAIISWQKEEDERKRERIFRTEIYGPFVEIGKALCSVYNFASYSEREEVAQEVARELYNVLPRFDASRGHRAFAYFSVVARHWLINRAKNLRRDRDRHVSYDYLQELRADGPLVDCSLHQTQERELAQRSVGTHSKSLMTESSQILWSAIRADALESDLPLDGENELKVIEACETICELSEELEIHTRTATRKYIMEYTGLTSKELSAAIKNLKKIYLENRDIVLKMDEFWGS